MKKFLLGLLLLVGLLPLMAWAENPFPKEWKPDLDLVAQSIENELEQSSAQQEMNLLSGRLAEVRDAELAIAYLHLYAALSKPSQEKLKAEQAVWLKKRERAIEEAAPMDEMRGSSSPMEANLVFLKLTEARTRELQSRLKKLP